MNERIGQLWSELRRRRVLHSIGIYLAGCWLLLQIFDIALIEVGLPSWTLTLFVWLVIISFPMVVLISWRYDISINGISRSPPTVHADGIDLSLKRVDYLVIILITSFVVGVSLSLVRVFSSDVPEIVIRQAEPNSIAVLPFENISGREEDEYLARGLAEDILHRLANIKGLRISSRTAAFDIDIINLDISTLGQRLGVESLLKGSVRREGVRLRVVTQLIDAGSGYNIWSGSYDREMEDLFSIYDEISYAVASELKLTLAPGSGSIAPPTSDIQAYDYFLQARSMLQDDVQANDYFQQARKMLRTDMSDYDAFRHSMSMLPGDTQAGKDYDQAKSMLKSSTGAESAANAYKFFTRAVESDPEFAQAWAGRCQALLDWYYYQPEPGKIEQAEASCRKAQELKPGLSEGRVALGDLYRNTGWFEQAIEEYQAVLETEKANAVAWLGLGATYVAQERDMEAEHAFIRAIDLDPDDLRSYYMLGAFLFKHGRYPEATSVYSRLAAHPDADASAYTGQGVAYYMSGDFEHAAAAYRQVIASAPTAITYSNIGTQYFYNGQFEDAAVMYEQALAMGPTNPVWWGNLGDTLQQMDGGRAAAQEAYQKAVELAGMLLQTNPEDADNLTNLAHYHARLGDDEQAMRYLTRAVTAAPHDFYAYYYATLVHLEAGRQQAALDAIRRSVELGYPTALLRADPQLEPLSSDVMFLDLIAEPAVAQEH